MQLCQVIWCRSLNLLVTRWQWSFHAFWPGVSNSVVDRNAEWSHSAHLISIKFVSAVDHSCFSRDLWKLREVMWKQPFISVYSLTFTIFIFYVSWNFVAGSSRFAEATQVENPWIKLLIRKRSIKCTKFLLVGLPSDERIRFKLSNFVLTFCLLNISDDGLLNVTSSFLCAARRSLNKYQTRRFACPYRDVRSRSMWRGNEFYERFDNEF